VNDAADISISAITIRHFDRLNERVDRLNGHFDRLNGRFRLVGADCSPIELRTPRNEGEVVFEKLFAFSISLIINVLIILLDWSKEENRNVLLLRGARQVGKSSAVRNLGKSFKYFLEINFEDADKRINWNG